MNRQSMEYGSEYQSIAQDIIGKQFTYRVVGSRLYNLFDGSVWKPTRVPLVAVIGCRDVPKRERDDR